VASTPDAGAGGGADAPAGGDGYELAAVRREGWAGTIRDGIYRPTGRRVAIQDVRADLAATAGLLARLADAGRAAAEVRDPRLVAVFDLIVKGGELHLVAEWSEARTIADAGPAPGLTTAAVVAVVDDVLAGLEALEAAGLYHGHVAEQSVVLEEDGHARLAEVAISAAATPDGGIRDDVRAAAAMGVRLLPAAGADAEAVRNLLTAASGAGSVLDPGGLRAQLRALPPAAAPGAPTKAPAPRRRRRRVLVAAALVLVLLAGGGTAYLLAAGHDGGTSTGVSTPLTVGADAAVTLSPSRGGCNTTFVFIARGSLTGAGPLVYRWELSDGQSSGDTSLTITPREGSFRLTDAWRLQGRQTVDGTATLHILQPVDRRIASPSFHYACP
jgi:hypothetical protein